METFNMDVIFADGATATIKVKADNEDEALDKIRQAVSEITDQEERE